LYSHAGRQISGFAYPYYTAGLFTNAVQYGIVPPEESGARPERKRDMCISFAAMSQKEHLEHPVSGLDCPDTVSARSYKAKQPGSMIS
jgi:hypothetical protein